jgi:hypothetical protein
MTAMIGAATVVDTVIAADTQTVFQAGMAALMLAADTAATLTVTVGMPAAAVTRADITAATLVDAVSREVTLAAMQEIAVASAAVAAVVTLVASLEVTAADTVAVIVNSLVLTFKGSGVRLRACCSFWGPSLAPVIGSVALSCKRALTVMHS